MIDIDTFLTYQYVMVDDFCKQHPTFEHYPGPGASLTCSEVVTLALFRQWCQFPGAKKGSKQKNGRQKGVQKRQKRGRSILMTCRMRNLRISGALSAC